MLVLGARPRLALGLAAAGAVTAGGADLASRLGEEWRWREHDLDAAGFAPHAVAAYDRESALLLSDVGVGLLIDGRLEVPEGWELGRPVGEALRLREGVVGRLIDSLVFLDAGGVRWEDDLSTRSRQGLRGLLRRRDGSVLVCRGEAIVAADAEGWTHFADGPAPDDSLLALGEDARGRLWTVTRTGIHRLDPEGWTAVPVAGGALDPRTLGRIVTVGARTHFLPVAEQRDVRGATWDGERLVPLEVARLNVDGATEPAVVGDALVTATWFGELLVLDGDTWSTAAPASLRGERVRSLERLGAGRLVVVTGRGRVLSCDLASDRWRTFLPGDTGPWCVVNAITPHPDGGLWIGTSGGLARFDGDGFEPVADRVGDVALQTITALETAEDGALWIGSGSGFRGAVRLDEDGPELTQRPTEVGEGFVHRIHRARDGALWFAMMDNYRESDVAGGLARLEDGEWTRFGAGDGLPIERCYDVLDTGDRVLAATALGPVVLRDGRWRPFGVPASGRLRAFCLFESAAGELWCGPGLGHRGVHRLEGGEFERVTGPGFTRIGAAGFAETSDGRIWVTGDHGVAVVDGEGLAHGVGEEPGAPTGRCWPILADAGGDLWIGSLGGGLIRHRPDDVAPPEVLDIALRATERGPVASLRGRDAWDGTPREQLRYRLRIDDGPWSEPFTDAEFPLRGLEDGATVTVEAIDLSGNRSATPHTVTYVRPPDPGAAWRTAGAWTIAALGALVLLLQARRIRERREARERARRRLLASERRYRAMVESADVVLCAFDADGRATYLSPRLAEVCGVPADSLDGSTMASRVHPDDVPALDLQVARRARGEEDPHGVEFRLRDAEGGWRWFWQVQSIRRSEDGGIAGFDTVAIDVTERRRLQEALQNAQRLESLGVMAGGVAHDFNNLLVGVLGNAELLRQKMRERPELVRLIEQIERAGREAGALCRRMLAYAGQARLDFAPVDLDALLKEVAELLRGTVPAGVELRIRTRNDGPLWVEGDASQLKQILLNLVLNGAEAIGERGGVVDVEATPVDADAPRPATFAVDHLAPATEVVVLEVRDDGAGVGESALPRVFDPFFSTKFEGRGLGLAAVAGIVKAHRGAIDVRSTPGAGATFRVWLPRADAGAAPPVASPPETAGLRGRILLVDDDAAVAGVAEAMLEDLGLESVTADGGERALEVWRREHARFDAVLLDVTMPDRDGVEVLREMRRVDPDARVVLTSGFAREETERRCAEVRPDGFLAKPYSSSDLERELLKVLGSSARSRGTA